MIICRAPPLWLVFTVETEALLEGSEPERISWVALACVGLGKGRRLGRVVHDVKYVLLDTIKKAGPSGPRKLGVNENAADYVLL